MLSASSHLKQIREELRPSGGVLCSVPVVLCSVLAVTVV